MGRTLGKETVLWNYKNKASQCRLARKNYGFVRQQEKICRNSFEVMPFVVKAAEETIQTCQQLFEKRRWNCSSILTAPDYTLDLVSGNQILSFVLKRYRTFLLEKCVSVRFSELIYLLCPEQFCI